MNDQVFTVYDSAAKRFLQPFFAETVEVACRMFRALVNKGDHQFSRFPEDYTLFHIGDFNAESGLIVPLTTPHSLGVALTFMDKPVARQLSLEVGNG